MPWFVLDTYCKSESQKKLWIWFCSEEPQIHTGNIFSQPLGHVTILIPCRDSRNQPSNSKISLNALISTFLVLIYILGQFCCIVTYGLWCTWSEFCFCKYIQRDEINWKSPLLYREWVSTGAAGAWARRSLGHHLLHPLIKRLLVLCAPAVLGPRALQDAPAPSDPNSFSC